MKRPSRAGSLRGCAEPRSVPDLVDALGEIGDAADVASIVSEIQQNPYRCGPAGLKALVALKRRGVSPDDEDVRAAAAAGTPRVHDSSRV
jgi:hypothetical protein